MEVSAEVQHDTLPSLRDVVPREFPPAVRIEHDLPLPHFPPGQTDGAVQRLASPSTRAPTLIGGVDGVGNGFIGPQGSFTVNSAPPDTNGAVGTTQYVQIVNSSIAVFKKSDKSVVFGPVNTATLWSGFGGICESDNDGDGVVVYDKAANRWVISQFAVTGAGTAGTPYLQCVAVSQTSDATGAYNRYSFAYGTIFPDYPKMGVWPDGYYTTFNMFNGNTFAGGKLCAYNRTAMLAGTAATQQCFQLSNSFGGVLPADLDGSTAPPAGAPNYLVAYGNDAASLDLWKFHVDWTTPANTTLTGPTNFAVATFTPACNGGTCIPQKSTTNKLDSLADRLMFRLAYRNFGANESLVVSHSVTVSGVAAVRWYEIRTPGTTPTVFQQSTFAPDTNYRWMGSIAMDQQGNMALGYSESSGTINPGINYTGRLVGDTLNTMQAEASLMAGTGSQTGTLHRWGDYSAMTIDPVDDCTFWFTTEYLKANGTFNWSTRIGSFKFPACSTKLNQTITFPNPGPVTYSASGTFPLGATASSGLAVTYTSTTIGVCTVSGSTVTIGTAGTCTINADQAGDATYNSAPTVSDNITISKASQTISYTSTAPAGATVGGATYNVAATGGASGNAVTFTIDAAASSVCTISGSTVSFIGAGTCVIDANQAGNTNYNAAPQAQQTFAVAAGTPTQLLFLQQPTNGTAGTALSPAVTVEVLDAGGNLVTSDNNSVTLTIATGPGGFDGISTITATFSNGVATFGNLIFDTAGTGYTLGATDAGDGLTATSSSFNIVAGTAAQLVFTTEPANVTQGNTLGTIAVTEEDAKGNVVNDNRNVDFTIAACSGSVDLGNVAMVNGVATLSGGSQRFYTVATGLTIGATGPSSLSVTSTGFNVVTGDLLLSDGFEACRL